MPGHTLAAEAGTAAPSPASAVSQAAAPGSSRVAERAASFLGTWLGACQGGPDEALEALYAPDFVGKRLIGKKWVTVPRAQWLKEQRPEGPAAQPARALLIREARVSGSSQHMVITLQVRWHDGKRQGQGTRDLRLEERGGALRVTSERLAPGPPVTRREPLETTTPSSLPPLRYRCDGVGCFEAAGELAEIQRECAAACATDASQCAELADMVQSARCGATADVGRAVSLWERACAVGGDPKACAKAAQLLLARKGDGDLPRALRLLGCEGPPSSKICNDWLAAQVLSASGDPRYLKRAVRIYLRGCGPEDSLTGDAEDCEKAAAIYQQGLLGEPDAEKAESLKDRASQIRMEEMRRAVEDPRVNRHRDL